MKGLLASLHGIVLLYNGSQQSLPGEQSLARQPKQIFILLRFCNM